VAVEDLSTWGFTRDRANQALKVKAYEIYGNKVDAIIGIEYEKIVGLLYSDNNLSRAFGTAIQFEEQMPSFERIKESTSLIPKKKPQVSSRTIRVVASSLSINKNYEVLGLVEVRNNKYMGI